MSNADHRTGKAGATRRLLLLGTVGGASGVGIMGLLSRSGAEAEMAFEVAHSDEEWRQRLTPAQYEVLRKHGTERAGTSPLDREKRTGTFLCAGCDQELFHSADKFRFPDRLAELHPSD